MTSDLLLGILSKLFKTLDFGTMMFESMNLMVELAFQSFMDSINGIMIDKLMSPDTLLGYSFVQTLHDASVACGVAILILIITWQSFKAMFSWAGFEADEPWRIAVKGVVMGLLTFFSMELLTIFVNINVRMMEVVSSAHGGDPIFNVLLSHFSFSGMQVFSLNFILMIYLLVKVIGAMFKMVERMAMNAFLITFSPLAFPTGASDPTKGFLTGFIRLFTGNLVVQFIQIGILNAIYIYTQQTGFKGNTAEQILALFMLIAFFKILGRLEEIVRDMSISVGLGVSMSQGLFSRASSMVYTSQSLMSVASKFAGSVV